jgi:proteasome lid subunit RPN8/RPN11
MVLLISARTKRIILNKEQYDAMTSHVKGDLPREACGILIGLAHRDTVLVRQLTSMRNLSDSENIFNVDSQELYRSLIKAESLGMEMVGIYHSHHMIPHPSSIDHFYMKLNPVVWIIFGVSENEIIGVAAHRWHDGKVFRVELEVR